MSTFDHYQLPKKEFMDFGSLTPKVNRYKEVLQNTKDYRKQWESHLKPMIKEGLEEFLSTSGIKGEVKEQSKITNLEAIVLDLGRSSSGLSENMEDTNIKRIMIKSNGALVYQQLFNGKIMIMIMSPYIEGYGEPKPPKTLEILRPEELKPPFILRHLDTLLKVITEWEDYDDDEPQRDTTSFNPIGFNRGLELEED